MIRVADFVNALSLRTLSSSTKTEWPIEQADTSKTYKTYEINYTWVPSDGSGALYLDEKFSKLYVTEPDLKAGGVDFFEGTGGGKPQEIEARMWIEHVMDDSKPLITKPEQAYVVTQILEAIYTSAATGKPVYFD